jgi:hypothetical protein
LDYQYLEELITWPNELKKNLKVPIPKHQPGKDSNQMRIQPTSFASCPNGTKTKAQVFVDRKFRELEDSL